MRLSRGGGGGRGYSNMNWYICAAQGLKIGGLGSGPSLKMRGFQSGPSREKQGILELKITKKRIFFLKKRGSFDLPRSEKRYKELYMFEKGVFWSGPGRRSRGFRSGKGRKMGGFRAAHTRTVLIWEYPSPPPPTPWGVYIQYYTIFWRINAVIIHSCKDCTFLR